MLRTFRPTLAALTAVVAVIASSGGCTSFGDYVRNGFKVGPNYCPPAAPVTPHWLDAADARLHQQSQDLSHWWLVFNDPVLNRLIFCASQQNLTLREAGFRILEARAQLNIAKGNLFPQTQDAFGDYRRVASSGAAAGAPAQFFSSWDYGFSLAWELDFWGRFRRAVIANEALLDASVFGYDQVLVTLLGDVASNYVEARTDQERIRLLQANVELQRNVLNFIERRFEQGFHVNALDVDQAKSNLAQTEAQIPPLVIDLRISTNQISILMGIPPVDVQNLIGSGPIPTTPPEVAVGIPADVLRRRPDVRQAERQAAAQAEEIGIAQADLYPAFTVNGTLGYSASEFRDLFRSNALNGNFGPSFRWNILNYGRIENNVRFQDARFQELVATYQNTVLTAEDEVENGIVTFLQSQQQTKLLSESVDAAQRAVKTVVLQYEAGAVDFNRYALIEQNLVTQQDSLAAAQGRIGQGLIQVYRALGGGWDPCPGPAGNVPPTNASAENAPANNAPAGNAPAGNVAQPSTTSPWGSPDATRPAPGWIPEQVPTPPANR
jgi:NodT family efflux transporter outer membrane factor (OMF) lipoprotein